MNQSRMARSKQSGRAPRMSMMSSGISRKSVGGGTATSDKSSNIRPPLQIFDEFDNDVTPLPLIPDGSNMQLRAQQGNILGDSATTPTDLMSQISASFTTSAFGGGPFTRSVFTHSMTDTASDSAHDDEALETPIWANIRQRADVMEVLSEEELDRVVDLTLEETDTVWLLDIPTICVALDSEEAGKVTENNKKYKELCKSRLGNDLYADRGMNTFNEAPKLKPIQTVRIGYADAGVTCTNWDMHDTYMAEEEKEKPQAKEGEEGSTSRATSPKDLDKDNRRLIGPRSESQKMISHSTQRLNSVQQGSIASEQRATVMDSIADQYQTISSSRTTSELFASKETGLASVPSDMGAFEEEQIMKSDSLRNHLVIMERVINLNTYQSKQALYRGLPVLESGETITSSESSTLTQLTANDIGPNLDRLWAYVCPLTKGHNVSCLTWNKSNPDLVAVGYGQFEFTAQKPGLICCWSLKNPEYPERVYQSRQGVTALDFSVRNANILAAGYYDGAVAIFNVRKTDDEPVMDNLETQGKHLGPVWQIRWIERERGSGEEKIEVLITISTDGRVTQWSIRKGFECFDIMKLKKLPTRMAGKAKDKKGEAFISRYAGGFCFDFTGQDYNVYLAGTDEGYIHKCSCSYNEQYLETYSGHTAPVYRIQWSPFVSDIFLSCSADWTIRLWHQDGIGPILNFHSCTKMVYDLCWSPRSSTVFACVNEGAVEVWDLSQSTLDPVISVGPTGNAKFSSVIFGNNCECILVGDSEGQVTVYNVRCMPVPPVPAEQETALNNVIKATLASQLVHHDVPDPIL